MKKNMGITDKIVRIIAAIILATLFFTGVVSDLLGYILLAFGAIFLLTSMVSFCPLYPLFKIKTNKKIKRE